MDYPDGQSMDTTELTLREVLELAREYRATRIKCGAIEVELLPQDYAPPVVSREPGGFIPSQAEIQQAADNARATPISDEYTKAFRGRLPQFPTR